MHQDNKKSKALIITIIILILLLIIGYFFYSRYNKNQNTDSLNSSTPTSSGGFFSSLFGTKKTTELNTTTGTLKIPANTDTNSKNSNTKEKTTAPTSNPGFFSNLMTSIFGGGSNSTSTSPIVNNGPSSNINGTVNNNTTIGSNNTNTTNTPSSSIVPNTSNDTSGLDLPTVLIDTPVDGSSVIDTIKITGWAVDNENRVGTAITSIKIYDNGILLTDKPNKVPRTDVCSIYYDRIGCKGGVNNVGFEYTITNAKTGGHQIRVEAQNATNQKGIKNASVTVEPKPAPDLTANEVTPSSVAVNTATTLSATINNLGNATTGKNFSNFFQISTSINGGGTISNLPPSTMSTLAGGSSSITTVSKTFTTLGNYSIRACADKSGSEDTGLITESDETNNCGPWTTLVVGNTANISTTPTIGTNSPTGELGLGTGNGLGGSNNTDNGGILGADGTFGGYTGISRGDGTDSLDRNGDHRPTITPDFMPLPVPDPTIVDPLTGLQPSNYPDLTLVPDTTTGVSTTGVTLTSTNSCDIVPLTFTEAEQAKIDELTRQYYLIAPSLKTNDDLVLLDNEKKENQDTIDKAEKLTNMCIEQKADPSYTGPQEVKDNPYYSHDSTDPYLPDFADFEALFKIW